MASWIPFEEGEYLTERSYLVADDSRALALEDLIVEIKTDARGEKYLRCRARVQPAGIVELHEEHDEFDLLIDFGHQFIFRMENPIMQGGKVFSREVTATVQIQPRGAWKPVAPEAFDKLVAGLEMVEL